MEVCVGVGAVCKSIAVASAADQVIASGTSVQCAMVVLSADSRDGGHMSILGYSKFEESILYHNYTSCRPHHAGRMGIRTVHCTAKTGGRNFNQTLLLSRGFS